ncbi:MAG: IS3 family transposase [Candidatus Izemoplasma sp.]
MNYTLELKMDIVEKYAQGESVTKISREFSIPRNSIYYWIENLKKKDIKEHLMSKRKLRDDQVKLDRVIRENDIMRYIIFDLNIKKKIKIELAHALNNLEYPIKTICRVLDIHTSTFYHDKKRKPKVTIIDLEDTKFRPLIKRIFEESDGRFGSRKIRRILMRDDNIISTKRVIRLMREMDLVSNLPDDNYNNYHKRNHSYKPNIISKSEHYPEPNKIWVCDITYIKVRNLHYYLFVIIDLYSRRVVGYVLSKTLEACVIVRLMNLTLTERGSPTKLIFHSDQGLQYTARVFTEFLGDNNVAQSFSKKGCPYDNSVAESFFASLKKEEIYRHIYNSYEHLLKAIDKYMVFYNTHRPHASLKYKTPIEFEETFQQSHKKRPSN